MIRVTWKDSCSHPNKPVTYRGYTISGYGNGWTTDMPGDHNIYHSHYCALNAIDAALGGHSRKRPPSQKRLSYGIQIVGQKEPPR